MTVSNGPTSITSSQWLNAVLRKIRQLIKCVIDELLFDTLIMYALFRVASALCHKTSGLLQNDTGNCTTIVHMRFRDNTVHAYLLEHTLNYE